jgi:circadian clock protein KaiC
MQKEITDRDPNRLSTGITGLDDMLSGGFPRGSMIVVSGRPGSGKTLLASEFLHEGATHGEPSVYVSFAETKDQFLVNMEKFGLQFGELIKEGTFSFIDLTTVAPEGISDALDLIVEQVGSVKGKRLVLDSFTSLAQAFEKVIDARIVLHVVLGKLVRDLGCTTIVLAEMPFGVDRIGLGIEEFVADGIIVMDVASQKGVPKRTINIRKMRGTEITLRPSSYDITKDGITIFPAIISSRKESMTDSRVPTGVPGFDELVEGGLMEKSITGVVGTAGTGKTTFGLRFAYSGAKDFGDRTLFVSFSESSDQVRLVARKLGMTGIEELEKQGALKIETIIPDECTPEEVILHLQELMEAVHPTRVVYDDVTALDAITDGDEFYRVLNTMAKLAQESGATTIISITTDDLVGTLITGKSVSTVMDGIVMLRYVELDGAVQRTLIILKMRATKHDHSVRKFSIGEGGITVNSPFRGYTGFISGVARRMISDFEADEKRIAAQQKKGHERRRGALEKRLKRLEASKTKTGRRTTQTNSR